MSSSNEYFREYNKTPKRKAYMKEYREKHKDKLKQQRKDYYNNNIEEAKKYEASPERQTYMKEYREKNKEEYRIYINGYCIKRRKNDNLFRLKHNIRSRFLSCLKAKDFHTLDIVDFTYEELLEKLLSDLPEGYIEWKNGELHIDHIIPVSAYNLENKEELKKCFSIRNLRLITKEENIKKHNKLLIEEIKKYNIEDLLPINNKKEG